MAMLREEAARFIGERLGGSPSRKIQGCGGFDVDCSVWMDPD